VEKTLEDLLGEYWQGFAQWLETSHQDWRSFGGNNIAALELRKIRELLEERLPKKPE